MFTPRCAPTLLLALIPLLTVAPAASATPQDARGAQSGAREKPSGGNGLGDAKGQDEQRQEKERRAKEQKAKKEGQSADARREQARPQQQADAKKLEQRKAAARGKDKEKGKAQARAGRPLKLSTAERDAVNRWAKEMRTHRDRVARIERLQELATRKKDRERSKELQQLLVRENKRHEKKLSRLEGSIPPRVLSSLETRFGIAAGRTPGEGAKKGETPERMRSGQENKTDARSRQR